MFDISGINPPIFFWVDYCHDHHLKDCQFYLAHWVEGLFPICLLLIVLWQRTIL
jgi:hypothetical protein